MSARFHLPAWHPQRVELNDEVHARPPEALSPPASISYLALVPPEGAPREQTLDSLRDLVRRVGGPEPAPGSSHYSTDLGAFRLKWERHTEFSRFMVIVPGVGADPFATTAIDAVPADWVAALPGTVIVAAHAALVPDEGKALDLAAIAARCFGGNHLIGAEVSGGRATAITDFRIHGDGFSRFLLLDRGTGQRQAGRIVQRLLEIDTYRIMALLALPVARDLSPVLGRHERELAAVTDALITCGENDEPVLLDRLTRLAAEIETGEARNRYRFSAAAAYYEIVQRRIEDLREGRIEGLQTIREFTERRLAPAMNTVRDVARRQEMLSQRVARATQLLSTRVDLTRERQNQALLASMDRRARLQLRLQQTVEGLSVAAITYYVVGLIGYAAKAFVGPQFPLGAEAITGLAVPLVAILVFLATRRVRRRMEREEP
ncbi:DUF3422 domain-containing protein [Roseomonas alkaliterrae]|jgi:uncharacterized membrane-anchored protein|uniref:Putative membrane-anchored protein n=1 Tax=Neoroseomonas alkaliterrae TaxID=1452450 RepID=A0A840XMP9_9PROT|nr:DUF3422 domain-containing protein [Neoroseomonas alkaliterrae]MBB5689865.1 putative membrane-anchored protein [Neoroseomonas alkaliterrae]MBR0675169.1 DUF3422 domain-containing protein [Neoroseomonas alkaliterrae]